jgi:hypothetical protein
VRCLQTMMILNSWTNLKLLELPPLKVGEASYNHHGIRFYDFCDFTATSEVSAPQQPASPTISAASPGVSSGSDSDSDDARTLTNTDDLSHSSHMLYRPLHRHFVERKMHQASSKNGNQTWMRNFQGGPKQGLEGGGSSTGNASGRVSRSMQA